MPLLGATADRGDVVEFTARTAARIGETSGVRRADINVGTWMWNVRRQTTTGPGGLIDKGTGGKRARLVPIIREIRPLAQRRLDVISDDPMARLFTGPRGGQIDRCSHSAYDFSVGMARFEPATP
jgi:integrase